MKLFSMSLLLVLVLVPMMTFGQVMIDPPLDRNRPIAFPDTPVGERSMIMINVTNNGREQCQVMLQQPGAPFFIDNGNLVVAPGGIGAITLTFAPQQAGNFRGELGGALAIGMRLQQLGPAPITGTGIEENFVPEITIDPEEIQVVVDEDNGPVEATLTIGNIGNEALVGEIEVPDLPWLAVEPDDFRIGEGDALDVTLTFGDDWPNNNDYELMLVIRSNDPENEAVEVPVLVSIAIPEYVDRVLQLREGWSMISSNVDFAPDFVDDDGPDFRMILDDIVEQVLVIKDGSGRFCAPPFDFWGLPQWDTHDGYLIKTIEETELTVRGLVIPFDRRIELARGWNMIAYYPTYDLEFGDALRELVNRDQLIIAKNQNGQFYSPEFGFGWEFMITPGEGIMVKMTEECSFEYPPQGERD